MKNLIEYIEKGLSLNIRETPGARLLNVGLDGTSGNIFTIALAGKLGIVEARKLIENAIKPRMNQSKAVNRVLDELGLSLEECERLVEAHRRMSASEILEKLKAGWTLDALSSHFQPQKDEFDTP